MRHVSFDYENFEDPAAKPFRLALCWFIEGCFRLCERAMICAGIFDRWLANRDWASHDRIAQNLLTYSLGAAGAFIAGLIVKAVIWSAR